MSDSPYLQRRDRIETYFDRTAVEAWARLTSDAPVSGIRATVRAGRDEMRRTLLSWLPADLRGRRVLDAGCGTGALAVEAALRGADVVAVDLSPKLIELARDRAPKSLGHGSLDFRVGDLLNPALGAFDHIVAMDSLIHYPAADVVPVLAGLAAQTRLSLQFTFAPRTPLLVVMRAVGRLFPRGDRAPWIEPMAESALRKVLSTDARFTALNMQRCHRVDSRFYISQALELVRR